MLLHDSYGWPLPWALLGTFAGIVIFRGGVDVIAHKLIPSPALYGAEAALKQATSSPGAGSGTGATSSASGSGSA